MFANAFFNDQICVDCASYLHPAGYHPQSQCMQLIGTNNQLQRFFSTRKAVLNLWVKCEEAPTVIKVPVSGCKDVADFAKKVKQELNTNRHIALFTSIENDALDPGFDFRKLLKTKLKNNSSAKPL